MGSGAPFLDYIDVAAAFVGGLVVAILGLLGAIHGDHLTEATVGVLAALSFSILRDRIAREDSDAHLTTLKRAVDDAVREFRSDYPYEQVGLHSEWDIASSEDASQQRVKDIRFTRNNVVSITERATSAGEVSRHVVKAGPPDGPLLPLQRATQTLTDDVGRPVLVLVLDRMWKVGETMRVQTDRQLKDCFVRDHEDVRVIVDHPTDKVTMTVRWPVDRPPRNVRFTRSLGGESQTEDISERVVHRNERAVLEGFKVASPRIGETLRVDWRWN